METKKVDIEADNKDLVEVTPKQDHLINQPQTEKKLSVKIQLEANKKKSIPKRFVNGLKKAGII